MRWVIAALLVIAGCHASEGEDAGAREDAGADVDVGEDAGADVGAREDAVADADVGAREDADVGAREDAGEDADAGADAGAEAGADGDAVSDAGVWDGALVCDPSDAGGDAASGTTFCEIWKDVFSPAGSAKCQSANCHGGYVDVAFFGMGWSGKECWDALTTHAIDWITPHAVVHVVPGGDARPSSNLPILVDPANTVGLVMPFVRSDGTNRVLDATERARIDAWLARGAPFD